MLVIRNCERCGKEYRRKPSHVEGSHFCSHSCRAKSRKHTEEDKRKISEALKGNKWNLGKKRTEEHLEKMRGKNNANWRDGASHTPYSVDWTSTLRRSIRERDRYICQICNEEQGDKAMSVHHIDYNKINCDPCNLITLCHSCHSKTNFNRDHWIGVFQEGI